MAKRTYHKKKRQLTPEEINGVRKWLDSAPQGRKPSIRMIAHRLGVTRPSVIKSLGGWQGIQRDRPEPIEKPKIDTEARPDIEPFTTEVDLSA